jgi:hypothetical protein
VSSLSLLPPHCSSIDITSRLEFCQYVMIIIFFFLLFQFCTISSTSGVKIRYSNNI